MMAFPTYYLMCEPTDFEINGWFTMVACMYGGYQLPSYMYTYTLFHVRIPPSPLQSLRMSCSSQQYTEYIATVAVI